jgi:hypothetical protein
LGVGIRGEGKVAFVLGDKGWRMYWVIRGLTHGKRGAGSCHPVTAKDVCIFATPNNPLCVRPAPQTIHTGLNPVSNPHCVWVVLRLELYLIWFMVAVKPSLLPPPSRRHIPRWRHKKGRVTRVNLVARARHILQLGQ